MPSNCVPSARHLETEFPELPWSTHLGAECQLIHSTGEVNANVKGRTFTPPFT